MDTTSLLFYLFAALLVLASLTVITSRNPVHAVLFLIFAFFNAAALFILIGAEYLAMTLVIVYVGAVAILFLFVVMMLDIKFSQLKRGFTRYLPLGGLVALSFFGLVGLLLNKGMESRPAIQASLPIPAPEEISNAHAIGHVLYTDYVYPFQIAGLILLVAMIGAILLTLRHRDGVRRQNVNKQLARRRADGVKLVDVESGKGV